MGDLDRELRACCCTTSARRSASRRRPRRQLDGRLHRGRGDDPGRRPRFEKLVLVSAAGISHARCNPPGPRRPPRGWRWSPRRSCCGFQERALLRPGLRFQTIRQRLPQPEQAALPSCSGSSSDSAPGTEGFLPAVLEPGRLRLPRPPRGGARCRRWIVWGRNDRVVPPADAGRLRRPPVATPAPSISTGRGHCADGRAPGAVLQPRSLDRVRRGSAVTPVRDRAPAEAEPTVFAYLAITPRARRAGSGGS